MGGLVNHIIRLMQVVCLPSDIPDDIEVDMTGVELSQALRISDMIVPDSVEILHPADAVVVGVALEKVIEEKVEEGEEEAVAEGEEATDTDAPKEDSEKKEDK